MITSVAQSTNVSQDVVFEVLKQTIGEESSVAQATQLLEMSKQQDDLKNTQKQVSETGRVDVKI